jgi:hypothetical protein
MAVELHVDDGADDLVMRPVGAAETVLAMG